MNAKQIQPVIFPHMPLQTECSTNTKWFLPILNPPIEVSALQFVHCTVEIFYSGSEEEDDKVRRLSITRHLLTDGAELGKLGRFQESLLSVLSFQKHNLKKRESWNQAAGSLFFLSLRYIPTAVHQSTVSRWCTTRHRLSMTLLNGINLTSRHNEDWSHGKRGGAGRCCDSWASP